MECKLVLFVAFLALVASSASAVDQRNIVSETILEDRHVIAYENDFFGTSHSIAKSWLHILEECHVLLPTGSLHRLFPNSNLPSGNVFYLEATPPFNACGIGIRPIGFENAGIYELFSYVNEEDAGGITLTRQKFGVTVREIDWRANEPDQ